MRLFYFSQGSYLLFITLTGNTVGGHEAIGIVYITIKYYLVNTLSTKAEWIINVNIFSTIKTVYGTDVICVSEEGTRQLAVYS